MYVRFELAELQVSPSHLSSLSSSTLWSTMSTAQLRSITTTTEVMDASLIRCMGTLFSSACRACAQYADSIVIATAQFNSTAGPLLHAFLSPHFLSLYSCPVIGKKKKIRYMAFKILLRLCAVMWTKSRSEGIKKIILDHKIMFLLINNPFNYNWQVW